MNEYKVKLGIQIDKGTPAKINKEIKSLESQLSDLKVNIDTSKLIGQTTQIRNSIKTITSTYQTEGGQILKITKQVKDGTDSYTTSLKNASNTAKQSKGNFGQMKSGIEGVNRSAKEGTSFAGNWAYNWSKAFQSFTTYLSVTTVFYTITHAIRAMIDEVIELDRNLIELQKVTDYSGDSLNDFVKKCYDAAEAVSKTGSEMVDAATQFAKAGYGEKDILNLGQIALMYTNIADEEISAGESAEFIIAQMKAFNIEASNAIHIIDAVNEVSNNFAVSSADIANNLGKSSAVMANAGNSYEQMIGLLTAGTEITRNAAKVSNGLKTITLRLQGMDDEGEKSLELVAQQEAMFNKLGLSVYDAEGSLKNTYEILKDLAPIYQSATAEMKAYITETIAGKFQAQNAAAILNNFGKAIEATEVAMNSFGSAEKENAKVAEGIESKLRKFKSAFQELSTTLVDSGLIKFFVDLGTTMLKFANSDIGQVLIALGALTIAVKVFNLALSSAIGKKVIAQVLISLSALKLSFVAAGGGAAGAAAAINVLAASMNWYLIAAVAVVGAALLINNAYKKNIETIKENNKQLDEANQKQYETYNKVKEEVSALEDLQEQLYNAKGNKSELLNVQKNLNKALGTEFDLLYDSDEAYKNANYLLEQQIDLKKQLAEQEKKSLWATTSSSYKTQEYDAKNLYGDTFLLKYFNQIAADDISGEDLDIYIQSYFGMIDEYGADAKKHWDEFWDAGTYDPDFQSMEEIFQDRYDTMHKYLEESFDENSSGIFDKSFFENALTTMIGKAADADSIQKGFQTIFDNVDELNKRISLYQMATKNGETGEKEWASFLQLWNEIKTSSYPLPYIFTTDMVDTIYSQGQAVIELGDAYQSMAHKRQKAEAGDDYFSSEIAVIDSLFQNLDGLSEKYRKFYDMVKLLADSGDLTEESLKKVMSEIDISELDFTNIGGSIEGVLDYFSSLNANTSDLIINLETLNESLDDVQSAYETLSSAIEEYNSQGYFSIDTLQSLNDISGEYLDYLFNENGQLQLNEEGFRNLALAQLEQMKVKQTEQLLKYAETLSGEGNQLENNKIKVDNLTEALQKENNELAKNIVLSQVSGDFTEEEISALENKIKKSSAFINQINSTMGKIKSGGSSISSKSSSKSTKEWWETALSDLKEQFGYSEITIETYISSLQNLLGKVKNGSEAWKKINEELQKQRLTKLKDDYSASRISLEQYIAGLKTLIKEYKTGTDAWNELAEAIKKAKLDALKEEQDNLKKALSAVNKSLDEQKDALNDAKDAELEKIDADIKAQEALKEITEKDISNYEKAQQAVLDYLNEQLDALNKTKEEAESYYDTAIDSLNKMNEEQAEAVELAEAYENLMNSMTEKTKKVWREGLGWVWETDQKAIENAKKTYEDLLHNATIKDIEGQKEATISSLEEQITALEDYISTWDEVLNKFDNEQNRNLANTLLGDNWSELVSTLNPEAVNNFGEAYYNLQKELEGYENKLEELNNEKDASNEYWDAQIKKLDEYIDKWKEISNSREDEQEKQIANAKLGADWEAQILDRRIDTLNKFKDKYNAILGEIDTLNGMSTNGAVNYSSPNVAGFANGGEINYTGLAMLHGTPSRPEYVLNNDQVKNLLSNLTRPQIVSTMSKKSDEAINNYNFGNIELPNVNNAQQFINELKSLVNTTKNQ